MNKQLAIILSIVVVGALTITYGAKVLLPKNKTHNQAVSQEQNMNGTQHVAQQTINPNTQQENGNNNQMPFDFKNIKSPEDLQNVAKKVGPYTCYITETDKTSGKVTKIIISTNGNNKVYLENKTNDGETSRVWIVDNVYYIETGKRDHLERIKITGNLARVYGNLINAAMGEGLIANSATFNANSDSNYKMNVQCKKGKVDIPTFNPSLFRGMNFNINIQQ